MKDFAFFEKSKAEVRTYSTNWNAPYKLLRSLGKHRLLSVLEDGTDERGNVRMVVRGSHMMELGNPLGLAKVNERFDITLPEDIDWFYRMYDGGCLLFQELYRLMPAEEIVEATLAYRRVTHEDPTVPNHIVRFCDLGEANHIALRRTPSGEWVVMYADSGYTTDQLLHDKGLIGEYTWDDSFASWLKRMCATDGWPSAMQVYASDEAPLQRIR